MKLKRAVEICLIGSAAVAFFLIIAGLVFDRPRDVTKADLSAAGTTTATASSNASGNATATSPIPGTTTANGAASTSPRPSTGSSGSSGTATDSGTTGTGASGGSGGSGSSGSTGGGTTPPPVACGQAGGSCTAAEVAGHNSRTDCWVIYDGYYYIVTSYVNSHPGGTQAFTSQTCGVDITAYLNGSIAPAGTQRHSHSATAYSILNSYKVGQVSG